MKKIILLFILVVVASLAIGFFFLRDKGFTDFGLGNDTDPFADTNLPNQQGNGTSGGDTTIDYQPQQPTPGFLPRLVKIFDGPTSGFTYRTITKTEIIDDEEVKREERLVYYIDRRTGYGYTYNIDTQETIQVSNKTIPGIVDTKFTPNSNTFVGVQVDKNDRVLTFTTPFIDKDGFSQINPVFLDDNLLQAELSPNGSQLAIGTDKNKKYELVVITTNTLKGTAIFESPITEWDATWINNTEILLQSKPASFSQGAAYIVNAKTGEKKRLIAGLNGVKALVNPTRNTSFLYSTGGNRINLYLQTSTSSKMLGEATLVDKCVWENTGAHIICARPIVLASGAFPENWYQGITFFKDIAVKINASTGETERIEVPLVHPTGKTIDATKLSLSSDNKKVFFVDKEDLSLWMLRLEEEVVQ